MVKIASTTAEYTRLRFTITSTSIKRYRIIAEANARGTRLSGTTDSSIGNEARNPSAYGRAYPSANGPAPNGVPHTIHRSWRRAVADRTRPSARTSTNKPAIMKDDR